MTTATERTYRLSIDGGLLGLERVLGLLRRRRVPVRRLAVHAGDAAERSRATLTIASANHVQVRRQLARLPDVHHQTDHEESHDDCEPRPHAVLRS